MRKFVVTTTIHEPTEALKKFASKPDWKLIVVGDKKTPHSSYSDFNCIYLTPEYQKDTYPELSDAIGWNCIQRRNIGFVEAYRLGADVVATVDDDNIPYEDWGLDLAVGETIPVDTYFTTKGVVFDPLQLTNHPELWHRGFPLESIPDSKDLNYIGKQNRKILIQAGLWDGDPDVDAVCRKMHVTGFMKLEIQAPFSTTQFSPFNSQNTFLAREILPYYMCIPHIGRMDDIWGGYIAEYFLHTRPLYTHATVFQQRNTQSLDKNLKDEILGYTETNNFLYNIHEFEGLLPEQALRAFNIYRGTYEELR